MPKRNMSFAQHFKAVQPTQIGMNARSLKFNLANRNIPDREIHYKGPHTKSLKGGYYSLGIWGFPMVVFVVPTYIWAQCKFNHKTAAFWGYDEH